MDNKKIIRCAIYSSRKMIVSPNGQKIDAMADTQEDNTDCQRESVRQKQKNKYFNGLLSKFHQLRGLNGL